MAIQFDALSVEGAQIVAAVHSDNMDQLDIAQGSKAAVQDLVALVATRKRVQRTTIADGSLGLRGLYEDLEPPAKRHAAGEQ
jgi:hypothetical protein